MGQKLTTKRVKGKLIFKHETEANWGQSNYIPEQGEKILYDPDESHNYTRVKYGDGSHTVKDLPFSPSDKIPQFPETTRDKVLTVNKEGEVEWKDYANLPVFDDVNEVPEDFPEESVYLIPADNGSFVTKAEMSARVDREAANRITEIKVQKERIDQLTELVPEATSSDKDKVLTANEDGTASWKTPSGGNGGTGSEQIQSDYEQNDATKLDYIKNRPFYEVPALADIAWNGDVQSFWNAGKAYPIYKDGPNDAGIDGFEVYVSDETPDASAFIGGTAVSITCTDYTTSEVSKTITANDVQDYRGIGAVIEMAIICVAEWSVATRIYQNLIKVRYEDEGEMKAGIYFSYGYSPANFNTCYTKSFTFEGAEPFIKKIDKKFLPDDISGINISAARVGQTIVVKAVDENGVPTEWEAVNLPKSVNIIAVDSYDDLPHAGSVSKGTIALVTSEVV